MIVLLPFLIIALTGDIVLYCSGAFSGRFPAVMALVFFLICFVGALVLYVGLIGIASLFVDKNKPADRPTAFWQFGARYTLKLLLVLCGVRIHLSGEDKIPQGRWLLVSNHRSAFDPITVICALDRHDLAFISKPSNFKIPIFGSFAHKICCLALDREDDRAAMKTILHAADLVKRDVCSFAIYPEGTRNEGEGLLPFRNGAFKIAQKAKVPIVVMKVENTEKVRRNFPFRPTHVYLNILEVISAEQVAELKTPEIGDEVRRCMECASV